MPSFQIPNGGCVMNREYYMPARGYEFYHRVVNSISSWTISEYVIFCLLYKHQWNTKWACFQRRDLLCNHNDGDLFSCEDNMLSSRVKIWSFRGKAHLVFHWCLCNKRNYSSCVRLDISLIGCAQLWDIESNTQRGIPMCSCIILCCKWWRYCSICHDCALRSSDVVNKKAWRNIL